MKYVVIGASGHYHQVMDAATEGLCPMPSGVAAGSAQEDVRAMAEKRNIPLYASWEQMVEEIRPDVAVVNPWFCDNAPVSMRLMKMGVDVYSEKPLATEISALDELYATWQETGRNLGCMFNLNCCAWYKAVEKAVADGEIGEVRMLHGQKSYRMGVRDGVYLHRKDYGGIIPWVAVHAVDWVLRLGGCCEWVSGVQTRIGNRGNGELEASSAMLMGLENGRIATVTADFLRPTGSARHDDDRLRVTGTRGMIEAVDGRVYLENETPRRELPLPPAENPFARFLNTRNTKAGRELTQQAFDASRVCLLARQSGDEGRILTMRP